MSKLFSLMLLSLLLESCQRDGGVIGTTRLSGMEGTFVIEDDMRTAPLTAAVHSVYYVRNKDRTLVFRGAGGSMPRLSVLSQGTVLIVYCGGTIEKTASILDGNPLSGRDVRARTIQPVVAEGLSVNGQGICKAPTSADIR